MGNASEINLKVIERLKYEIKKSGLSQAEISRRTHYHKNMINNILRGRNNLTEEMAESLSQLLGVSADYLLCRTDMPTEHWKGLFDHINDYNIEYYTKRFSAGIKISYDPASEMFTVSDSKNKRSVEATKDQMDSYCKYFDRKTTNLQSLFFDLLA